MLWEKKLAQWVDEVRNKANLPARLVLWNGQQLDFGNFAAPQVTLKVNHASALPLLLDPSLDNLGEAYVKGKIDIEGKLTDIIDIGYSLARNTVTNASKLARVKRYFTHSKTSDKKAIQYHYDVSNDFYKLWLDPNMVYSCAYFENGDEDLATAQLKKIDHILTKIQLQPGQRLLDIGCGWGALVLRAAEKFGAQCVGVTLSQNQFDLATERVKAAGLQDRIEIRLQDYRDVQGQFDRITSVGMFEHVGPKNYRAYFEVANRCLDDHGLFLLHTIGKNRRGTHSDPWIDKYIFPNGELPTIGQIADASGDMFVAEDLHNFGADYDRTLMAWYANFVAAWPKLQAKMGERFFRMWSYYLLSCAGGFRAREIQLWQWVLSKRGVPGGYERPALG